MNQTQVEQKPATFEVPYPGSREIPPWTAGQLGSAPVFTLRNWVALLGPGLIAGGSAIGGGEWLMGPAITARYGGAMMWLATLSILAQVVYNIEISRYTLYCGEPIFTGKFRTLPGPRFWLPIYLLLDFGAFFPYLAATAATPVAAVWLGRLPDEGDRIFLRWLGIGIFLLAMLPLLVGGKVYKSLQALMVFKIVAVLGFLLFLAVFFSHWSSWVEIISGFFRFGDVPVRDGHVENAILSLWQLGRWPDVDTAVIAQLTAFAAIAGMGGLTNTPISNYTRDQGWGMGRHVGAIPSVIGGHHIHLSHVGMVFQITREALVRWRGWFRHMLRDQLVVWMPACLLGIALPSMLSVEFLPRGTKASEWSLAGMTADGVRDRIAASSWGPGFGNACWYATLAIGLVVLFPSMAQYADGFVRRWVDVFWTSSSRLRRWETYKIRRLYYSVLAGFVLFGICMLSINKPMRLLAIATNIANYALGFSCWHTLILNVTLLPRELRPGWFQRIGLLLAGLFFFTLGALTTAVMLHAK